MVTIRILFGSRKNVFEHIWVKGFLASLMASLLGLGVVVRL